MSKWEHCAVYVALYRDGTGGGTRELLSVQMPGENLFRAHALTDLGHAHVLSGKRVTEIHLPPLETRPAAPSHRDCGAVEVVREFVEPAIHARERV